ncbi:MAG: S-layer homology domain-containing protein [Thermoanaerobaculia bacterium]
MLKQHNGVFTPWLGILSLLILSIAAPLPAGFREWTSRGPDGGRIRAVAVDASSPQIVYVGSTDGFVSRSLDGGATWEAIPSTYSAATIRALATQEAAPGLVFAAGAGAYRSFDHGETWGLVDPQIGEIEDIVIDPSTPMTVYAAGSGGVAKTVNGGDEWFPAHSGLPGLVYSLVVDPSQPEILYAGTTAAIYKSVDGGQQWTWSSSGIINASSADALAVAIDPATPTTLVAATESGTYRSIDGAGSWVLTTLQGAVNELRIDPAAPNVIYAATNSGVKRSTDAGSSWTGDLPTNPLVLALGVDPTVPGRVWAGTDGGGVYRSDDFGVAWSASNRGLGRCAVNAVAVHPDDPANVYVGTGGAGVARSEEAGDNWFDWSAGLTRPSVKTVVVHPAFPLVLFAGTDDGTIGGFFASADGGANWFQIGLGNERLRQIAVDPGDPFVILAVGPFTGVDRSIDNGTHWGRVSTWEGLPSAEGASLAFDPAGNGIVYVATGAGVYKSFDHGASWQPQGLADVSVRSLAVDPFAPQTLYAGSASGPYALFKSETGGQSWSPAGTGLILPIHAIVADPTTPDTLYTAGNTGVYLTTTGGDSWSPLGDSPSLVTSLAIDSGGNVLHAGTSAHGVSEYQLHFFDAPPGSLFRDPVETIAGHGISSGCGAGNFCVGKPLTRAQASVWLLRARHAGDYEPPPASGTVFLDVPADAFAAAWIEQLAAEGVTSGCGAEGFCPGSATTRAQLAVWLLRAKHGSTYTPPPATGLVFADVPADAFAAAWIEALAAEGITTGCGGGNFCPSDPTTRGQAAALLVRTFELE